MTKWIEVVQGLVVDTTTKKILMAHRPPNKVKPLLWEYPGGKVEKKDKSYQEALWRELDEELGIDATIGPLLQKHEFYWKDNVSVYLYAVTLWKGEPKPLVATELRWVEPEFAIDHLPCLPSVYASYREVTSFVKRLP